MSNCVRDQRIRSGLGQSELAAQAGVTRQQLGAIEAGRHSPSVDAALRIARALGLPVETLFAPADAALGTPVPVGGPLPVGAPVVVGRVGDRRVYAPVRHLLSTSEAWAVADGFVADGFVADHGDHGDHGGIDLMAYSDESGLVVGGCDPLLGLAAGVLARCGGPRVIAVHLSTGACVSALAAGVVHAVVVHGPQGDPIQPPVPVDRWRVASWQVGVASSGTARRTIGSVEELATRRLRTAQREVGAGTQGALERALTRVGASGLPGPRVDGHVDAARHVVAGLPAGITMEAAACAFGLRFLPLETHRSELWIDARYRDHRGAVALVALLRDPALVQRAQRLPGYDVADMGSEVSVA